MIDTRNIMRLRRSGVSVEVKVTVCCNVHVVYSF